MKHLFNSRTFLIASLILLAFTGGFVLGLRQGTIFGQRNTTEVRNQMLDIKPYDASLPVKDLEYLDVSPAGVTIEFNTDRHPKSVIEISYLEDLIVQWTIYPSDVFYSTKVVYPIMSDRLYRAKIETYPEGGTLMFRIIDSRFPEVNRGSLWFYIDLPRPNNSVLPPPYMPKEERQ